MTKIINFRIVKIKYQKMCYYDIGGLLFSLINNVLL